MGAREASSPAEQPGGRLGRVHVKLPELLVAGVGECGGRDW